MRTEKIFVAGHKGLVGSSICRALRQRDNVRLVTKNREELDLTDAVLVKEFLNFEKPDTVIMAAAKVGGIQSNYNFPAQFIYDNLAIQTNLIHGSHLANVQKILFLGSSCIYPKYAAQPIIESALLTGPLEKTNEPYAIAKIAGIKMCDSYNKEYNRDYRSIMPTNLFGPFDNFHPENSHVIPGLMRRIHEAKIQNDSVVTIWGSGNAKREFLYVDDLARAVVFLLALEPKIYKSSLEENTSHLNVGSGKDLSIRELAMLICEVVGFEGSLVFDESKPDGTPRKLLNVEVLSKLGWNASIELRDGLQKTYDWFINHTGSQRF